METVRCKWGLTVYSHFSYTEASLEAPVQSIRADTEGCELSAVGQLHLILARCSAYTQSYSVFSCAVGMIVAASSCIMRIKRDHALSVLNRPLGTIMFGLILMMPITMMMMIMDFARSP